MDSKKDDLLDSALRAAYGPDPVDGALPDDSVIDLLRSRYEKKRRVVLHADGGLTASPADGSEPGAEKEKPSPDRYRVVGELGRGGLGTVIRSRDMDLGRDVAMKVLLEQHLARGDLVRRLVEEAQIGGQLQHPGVVPVYDVGIRSDNRPYFTMKLVEGETLAVLLKDRGSSGEDRMRFLRIFEQVCQTMAYAHARGVIHRDLKPSNIMVGAFGETQVMDWGLAKVLDAAEPEAGRQADPVIPGEGDTADHGSKDETAAPGRHKSPETVRTGSSEYRSQSGSVMGTIAYMAPEQARGEVEDLDERCDVFGLGAILCQILTGKPPFSGETTEAAMRMAREGRVDECMERLETSGADPVLVELARHCLTPEPENRLRDAAVVAAAMEEYFASVEERARSLEVSAAEARVRAEEAEARAVQERRARKLGISLAAVVLVAVVGGSLWYGWSRAERQKQREGTIAVINSALAEAISKSGEARASTDLDHRLEGWQQALFMGRRARDMLIESGVDDEALRERSDRLITEAETSEAEVRAAIEQAATDREMAGRLESIRQQTGEDWDWGAMDRRFAAAFRNYGIDIESLDPGEAAARIRASAVSHDLISVMNEWFDARTKTGKAVDTLLKVASLADDDPWREDLRRAMARGDDQRVREIAGALDPAVARPGDVYTLSFYLDSIDRPATVALLADALHHHPDDYWLNFRMGWICVDMKPRRTKEAVGYYRTALSLRPLSDAAWNNLGIALMHDGQIEEARRAYERALELDPDDPVGLGCYGIFLRLYLHDHQGALSVLRRALEIDPDDAGNHAALGDAYAQDHGDIARAWTHYERAVELDPRRVDALGNMGVILMYQGDFEGTLEILEKALEVEPGNALNQFNLGVTLDQLGRTEEAGAAYRKAVQYDPNLECAWSNLGHHLVDAGDVEAGMDCFDKVLALPSKPTSYRVTSGLPPGRENELVIKQSTTHVLIHERIGTILLDRGELAEAAEHLSRASELDPQNADAIYYLGLARERMGDLTEARRCFEKALSISPYHADAKCSLERLQEKE